MRTVTVTWDRSGSRFVASGTHAGREITINAPHTPEQAGGPTGFSATELLLAGAGACASWDVLEVMRKRRQRPLALDVTVESEQDPTPPWTYRSVKLHFRLSGSGLRLPVVQRVIRLSVVRYCSVVSTIRGVAEIAATVEVVDADGTSSGRHPVSLSPMTTPASLQSSEVLTKDEE